MVLVVLWVRAAGAQAPCPPAPAEPTPAQRQDAIRNARDRGALWRFQKDGRAGYLYGTLHVGKLEWAIPGRAVARALGEVETIVLEANPADAAFRADMIAPPTSADGAPLPPALAARLRDYATKVCAPWDALATMPPMLIATTLSVLEARFEGLHPEWGTEMVLVGIAKGAKKELATFETAAVQRRALLGGSRAEQLAAVEQAVTGLEKGEARSMPRATANAWAAGDLDALARQLATLPTAEQAMLERVVGTRNPAIAARIEAMHAAGRRIFATTGILHMVGDTGLPALLTARGFAVERVTFASQGDTP